MRSMIQCCCALLLLAVCGLATVSAQSATVVIDANNSGNYRSNGFHDSTNPNFIVGQISATQFHNFFVFDLSGVAGKVKSASLSVLNPDFGYNSSDPSETFTVFDVSTPVSALNADQANAVDIFNDLGSGTTYGSTDVPDTSDNTVITFDLNAAAIDAINNNHTQFAIGGALTSLNPSTNQFIFAGTGDFGDIIQLNLTLESPIVISEFRLSGENGLNDEFIELYNNTDAPFTVNAMDGSAGWSLVVSSDGFARFTVPNGTVIPARGHYLATNSQGYSLGFYPGGNTNSNATGNITYTTNIPEDAGIALFTSATPADWTLANRVDAVGFDTVTNPLYREGAGLPFEFTAAEQYSYIRHSATSSTASGGVSGIPQDTDNNAADFTLVSTTSTVADTPVVLGAPGPENLSSPVLRNDNQFGIQDLDPAACKGCAPNRVRAGSGGEGTLAIRRTFTNNTGQGVTRLRFRIVDITTLHSPVTGDGTQAILTAVTAPDETVATSTGNKLVRGTTLEEPPDQTFPGGGLNSSLSAGSVTLLAPLANGASVNLQFLLNVQQAGRFRFFVAIEALTQQFSPTIRRPRPVTRKFLGKMMER
jgi:hypothetical protein